MTGRKATVERLWLLLCYDRPMKKVYVYVDSFNLYYGALKPNPKYKWLNIEKLILSLLPDKNYSIEKIKFCTARVSASDFDLDKPVRQDIYFRALSTLKKLEFIWGKYKSKPVRIQVTKDVKIQGKTFEEKGTDVNVAVHMVHDAYENNYDVAVLVSNDSDVAEALRIVKDKLGKEIWLINPGLQSPTTKTLSQYASEVRKLRFGHIKDSQFSNELTDKVGIFHKPKTW